MKRKLGLIIVFLLVGALSFVSSYNVICPEGFSVETLSEGGKICISEPVKNNQGYPIPFSEKYIGIQCPEGLVKKSYGGGEICESTSGTQSNSLIQAGNIQTNLQSFLGTSSSGTSTSVSGEAFALFTSSSKINSDGENHEGEKEDCHLNKGCYTNGNHKECYPYGYILNGTYCSGEGRTLSGKTAEESAGFKKQKATGEECEQSFQCITNFCSEGFCINKTEEINRQVDAKIDEMKQDIVYKIEGSLEELNQTENLSINTEYGGVSID
ncbi:MAG: hypothetical protein KJ721_00270, partial [Nanoarchaeota archaeon]|nr:hypothetical protein [Nanoarchaeota archaeon]